MLSQILCMLESGMRPMEIARSLSASPDVVYWVARKHGFRFTRDNLTQEEKAKIRRLRESEGLSVRQIAQQMNRPTSTIGDWARKRFCEVADEGGEGPKILKEPRRCPRHGLVRLWPCVACLADPI